LDLSLACSWPSTPRVLPRRKTGLGVTGGVLSRRQSRALRDFRSMIFEIRLGQNKRRDSWICICGTRKVRSAHPNSVESSIYLRHDVLGRGIGKELYSRLLTELAARDYHAIIGGISFPNEASVRLHEKLGFVKIGAFREVGFKFGRWIDMGYWELVLTNHNTQTVS
jgi:L-amino acid N-acyltransferase YncA